MKNTALSLFLNVLMIARCESRLYPAEEGLPRMLVRVPPAAAAQTNPIEAQSGAAAAGRKLFLRHCAHCHGRAGSGNRRAVDLHDQVIQDAPAGSLFWLIRNGNLTKGMPAWSHLPDQQLWQIVSYLKTMQQK